jgi:hypothetical protein
LRRLLLQRGEISRRDVVKYLAIRRQLFFEKTLLDEFRDGLCNSWRPSLDAGVEHPPMKNAVQGVLSLRMAAQIIETFWRRRWKWRTALHTFGMLIVVLSKGRAWAYPSCAWKISYLQAGVPPSLNSPSGNWLTELCLCD